ncbi:MAG: aldose 1-epimerase [Spirochaetales bacterium]|nr:aldose 1-epimerase [Spirochaetales bacterium]
MYRFTTLIVGGIETLRCENRKNGTFIEIFPGLGGTIHRIGLKDPKGEGVLNILTCDSHKEILENPWFRGRFLFPFNDRIPGGLYSFEGRQYCLPINEPETGDAIHGSIYNKPVQNLKTEIVTGMKNGTGKSEFSAVIRWDIEGGPGEGYPFKPVLSVKLLFSGDSLTLSFTVRNRGETPLPFSLGWHPYFNLTPADARGGGVDHLMLSIPAGRYIEVDRKLLPTGKLFPLAGGEYDFSHSRRIGRGALDLGFSMLDGDVILSDGERRLVVRQGKKSFPYLQAFIPPGRGSIALEPVSAGTNAFNRPNLGLNTLKPGSEWSGWFSVGLYSSRV